MQSQKVEGTMHSCNASNYTQGQLQGLKHEQEQLIQRIQQQLQRSSTKTLLRETSEAYEFQLPSKVSGYNPAE